MTEKDPEDILIDILRKILRDLGLLGFFPRHFSSEEEKLIKDLLNNTKFHGFWITIDPDGKPVIREIGFSPLENTNTLLNNAFKLDNGVEDYVGGNNCLIDVFDEGDEVTVITEVPSVEDVSIEVVDNSRLVIRTPHGAREVELSSKVYGKPVKVNCRNGICEVVLKKLLP